MNILVVVNHAVGRTDRHRKVISALNGLSRRSDTDVRLLCNEVDHTEPYLPVRGVEICLGFNSHDGSSLFGNSAKFRQALNGMDYVYSPTGLNSFVCRWAWCGDRSLMDGPNCRHPRIDGHREPGPRDDCEDGRCLHRDIKCAGSWLRASRNAANSHPWCYRAHRPNTLQHRVGSTVRVDGL